MSRLIHCLSCVLAVVLGSASPHELRTDAQDASRWTVGDRALVSIGDDGVDTLILRAWSAVRLSNGAIVVASSRNSVLQWFDASGKHIRTVGRRGQGPAEFGGSLFVYAGPGDTVIAYDERNRRYNYYNASGDYIRVDTLGDSRRAGWLYDRTAVYRTPSTVDFGRLRTTLSRIPLAPRDTVRHARIDAAGNVWLRSPTDKRSFTIYAPDARVLGAVTLPPRFDAYQILDTLILGHWLDDDDVEHIQLRRLTRGRVPAAATAPASASASARPVYDQDAELRTHAVLITRMRSLARNLFTAQEAHFADFNRYAPSVETLTRAGVVNLPPEFKFTIFAAQPNSYRLLGEHAATRIVCIAVYENDLLPGPTPLCG